MAKRKRPVIGISADSNQGREYDLVDYKGDTVLWLKKSYTDAVEKSGATPVILPIVKAKGTIDAYLSLIDGIILSGGHFDIDPKLFGEKPIPQCGPLKPDRTLMEIALFKKARKTGMPILGICGGMQAINVGLGGTLYQHIPDQVPNALKHEQKPKPTKPSHNVALAKGSILKRIAGKDTLKVNSTHHQSVKDLGRGLTACAKAKDGVIEALEPVDAKGSFIVGVQWHPEQLFDSDLFSRKLFKRFVASCGKYRDSDK